MIRDFDELVAKTKAMENKTRVALCCAQDHHALEAIAAARKQGLIEAVLLGDTKSIQGILHELGEDPASYELLECMDANEAVERAAQLVHAGEAGVIMKGKLQTSELMRGVLKKENGLRQSPVLSVCGQFQLASYPAGYAPRLFSVTDPALNVEPDLAGKKAILENAVRLRHALGDENPKVAVIAANEMVNPKMQDTVDAAALKEMNQSGEISGCIVEGPISLDLAMNPQAAKIKGFISPVAGDADLLVMPNLTSANVLAKSITELGGGTTAGVVLGAKVPIVLVSRAAEASDKFYSIVLAAYTARNY